MIFSKSAVGYAHARSAYSPVSMFTITFHGVPVTQKLAHSACWSFTFCANFPLSTQDLNHASSHPSSLLL